MAGHSKWANIKHRKARQDASRGKIWTKVIREITVAAKDGPDPADNPRLRLALEKANSANMPKDTIKRAIEKGSGTGETGVLEEITFEGYGPGGVAILVETMTDNRNRTVSDVRHAFSKYGGNLGTDGSVSYLFKKLGIVQVDKNFTEEELMEIVIDIGADDLSEEGDFFEIITDSNSFNDVVDAIKEKKIKYNNAELTLRAETLVKLDNEMSEKVLNIMEFMDDLDDVQEVHTNKGAAFERQIAKALIEDLNLKNPVKRILEQTRTKELPDLMLGTWCIECKAYGTGAEPRPDWWDQVLTSSNQHNLKPALVYKFNNRPIKVRILASSLNKDIKNDLVTVDLLWPDFIQIILELFQEDIELHEQTYQV